jgi:nicotinamide riboside transporter PnuC
MTLIHVFSLVLAVLGVFLNNRKRRLCFACWLFSNLFWSCYVCWLVSNFAWAVINWTHGLHIEALQNAIFLYLAVEGIYKWRGERW